jgi:hypothetical protein
MITVRRQIGGAMPCVEGKISGVTLTEELAARLEEEITAALRDEVSLAFPAEMGFLEGTPEYDIAHRIAREIMPGWTWVNLTEARWAVRGRRVGADAITARFHILVLSNALLQNYRRTIAVTVEDTAAKILGEYGKPVNLFVDVVEGEVDMTLPRDLFGDLLAGASDKLLDPGGVVQFLMAEVLKEVHRAN